ncbi:hypothetical protein [Methanimicrococcus hongohii]|uniref:hypothetical protein n=1 Tax=Methanimicrococcus hongohii TaxID=3028295 RepID=UPI00293124CD|nr:hypothetical protein [Methanimicrococcus sp. Hf6]
MKNKILVFGLLGLLLIGTALSVNAFSTNEKLPFEFVHEINVSYPQYSYEDLYEKSDLIIYGSITSNISMWSTPDSKMPSGIKFIPGKDEYGEYIEYYIDLNDDEIIYTDFIFKVDKAFKGNLEDNEIIVRSFGGTVDNFTIQMNGGSNFTNYKEGDKILLYLIKDKGSTKDIGHSHYTILTPKGQLIPYGDMYINGYDEKITLKEMNL